MIKLVAYDSAWPAMFEVEANEIRRMFGDLALRVEHVGSTAVRWPLGQTCDRHSDLRHLPRHALTPT